MSDEREMPAVPTLQFTMQAHAVKWVPGGDDGDDGGYWEQTGFWAAVIEAVADRLVHHFTDALHKRASAELQVLVKERIEAAIETQVRDMLTAEIPQFDQWGERQGALIEAWRVALRGARGEAREAAGRG